MLKLQGKSIYLKALERKDCRMLWKDYEYDFDLPAEEFRIGYSDEQADQWFEEIQKQQGSKNVRLGIFLFDGFVIGDVALQDIDMVNRNCSMGIGIAKLEHRSKNYGEQAVELMLDYGFRYLGMERIYAHTLDINKRMKKVLEKCHFKLEGTERKAKYLNGSMHDRLLYAVLKEEYLK